MQSSRFVLAILAACLPFTVMAKTPAKPAEAVAEPKYITREELPALIKEALMNDPEMITNAVRKMRERQEADAKQKAETALKERKNEIMNDTASPSIGDPKTADVTIVEFFDYHCGYCKRLLPTITQLTNEDKKLRVIFKEYPILSEESILASRAALAVNTIAKDKYFAYHTALMKHEGKFDEASLLELAKKNGIDDKKLKEELSKPAVAEEVEKNHKLGDALGVRGTPAIIIGDTLLPGAVPYEQMKKLIADVRSGKKIELPER